MNTEQLNLYSNLLEGAHFKSTFWYPNPTAFESIVSKDYDDLNTLKKHLTKEIVNIFPTTEIRIFFEKEYEQKLFNDLDFEVADEDLRIELIRRLDLHDFDTLKLIILDLMQLVRHDQAIKMTNCKGRLSIVIYEVEQRLSILVSVWFKTLEMIFTPNSDNYTISSLIRLNYDKGYKALFKATYQSFMYKNGFITDQNKEMIGEAIYMDSWELFEKKLALIPGDILKNNRGKNDSMFRFFDSSKSKKNKNGATIQTFFFEILQKKVLAHYSNTKNNLSKSIFVETPLNETNEPHEWDLDDNSRFRDFVSKCTNSKVKLFLELKLDLELEDREIAEKYFNVTYENFKSNVKIGIYKYIRENFKY